MRLLEALAAIGPLLEPSGKPISDLGARLSGKRVGLCMRRKNIEPCQPRVKSPP